MTVDDTSSLFAQPGEYSGSRISDDPYHGITVLEITLTPVCLNTEDHSNPYPRQLTGHGERGELPQRAGWGGAATKPEGFALFSSLGMACTDTIIW